MAGGDGDLVGYFRQVHSHVSTHLNFRLYSNIMWPAGQAGQQRNVRLAY